MRLATKSANTLLYLASAITAAIADASYLAIELLRA
jgi:hypothetical protein